MMQTDTVQTAILSLETTCYKCFGNRATVRCLVHLNLIGHNIQEITNAIVRLISPLLVLTRRCDTLRSVRDVQTQVVVRSVLSPSLFMSPSATHTHTHTHTNVHSLETGTGNTCSDAQGSVAELSCEESQDNAGADDDVVAKDDEVDIAGGRWSLVRRVKAGKQWHPATDHLKGTDRYGPLETTLTGWRDKKDMTWTTPFADKDYDQVMIALCDLSKWIISSRSQVEETDSNKATIVQSSSRDAPYEVSWYNRKGKSGDPVISMTTPSDTSNILYREDSEVAPSLVESHEGACVFVRSKDLSRGDLCPAGEFDHGGICSACRTECPLGSFKDGGCVGHYDTQCSTCDEMCSETTGCLKRGTLKNVECRGCRYVEEKERVGTRCKRQCSSGNYNKRGVCTACTKTCRANYYKTSSCYTSKDFESDHDLVCKRCRSCVGRSYDSGRGCNRRAGLVTQDRQCVSCHSECRSPPSWRYYRDSACTGPGNNQCRFGCRVVSHGGRCLSRCPGGYYKNGGSCSRCTSCPSGWGWYKSYSCNRYHNTGCGWSWWSYWHAWWKDWRRRHRWWWSDKRLKCDIRLVEERSNGLSLYSFRYLGGLDPYDETVSCDVLDIVTTNISSSSSSSSLACEGPTYIGVLAQDLLGSENEHAIRGMCDGRYYSVDYDAVNQTLVRVK